MKTNNSYLEIGELIKKVQKLGVNIIEDGGKPIMKSLTIIVCKEDGIKEMVPFKYITPDGNEVGLCPSPFTWRLGFAEFIEWAKMAISEPFALFNKIIAKQVKEMDNESFETLRLHSNLENEMFEYFMQELKYLGVGRIKLSAPKLFRLSLIYGGLLHRERGVERLISDLFEMVLLGKFIPDKCRSCMWCKNKGNKGTGRICKSPLNEGFVIPDDMSLGELNKFPDIDVRKYGDYKEYVTSWVPGRMQTCDFYNRRW